jgi:hypothetical protein
VEASLGRHRGDRRGAPADIRLTTVREDRTSRRSRHHDCSKRCDPLGGDGAGYFEGANLVTEYCRADGRSDVLATHGIPGARVAQQATTKGPIVMTIDTDPVAAGPALNLPAPFVAPAAGSPWHRTGGTPADAAGQSVRGRNQADGTIETFSRHCRYQSTNAIQTVGFTLLRVTYTWRM